jgi:hypothetical protein
MFTAKDVMPLHPLRDDRLSQRAVVLVCAELKPLAEVAMKAVHAHQAVAMGCGTL